MRAVRPGTATIAERTETPGSRGPGGKDPLKQVAQQVEGMFVQMMLKSMRETLPKDGMFSSDSTRLYTSMYDQQIAQQMSQKGLGLADMMVKQIAADAGQAVTRQQPGPSPMKPGNELPAIAAGAPGAGADGAQSDAKARPPAAPRQPAG